MEEKKICWYNLLGGTDRIKLNGILQYLKDEWKAKRGGDLDPNDEWELVTSSTSYVPQQDNGERDKLFECIQGYFSPSLSLTSL